MSIRHAAAAVSFILVGVCQAATPDISSKRSHTLAIDNAGAVYSWGSDTLGQLGVGRALFATSPTRVTGIPAMASVEAGTNHVVAVDTAGNVWTWGGNVFGQLGRRAQPNDARPGIVLGLSGVTAVSAGQTFTAALKSDGTVWVWGSDAGVGSYSSTPRRVAGLQGITRIDAGDGHLLALKSDGTVWAMGQNWSGQMGDGTTNERAVPYQVPGLASVSAIAAGYAQSIAVKNDGTVVAWGANYPQGSPRLSPLPVAGLTGVASVAADQYSFAVRTNGTVSYWDNSYTPVAYSTFTEVQRFSAGGGASGYTTFAVTNAGALVTEGGNGSGQRGLGDTAFSAGIATVPGISGLTHVAGGFHFGAARRNDGAIFVWGSNAQGQMANGDIISRSIPGRVAGLPSTITAVKAGSEFSLALQGDGAVWGWGNNDGGQIGAPAGTPRSVPALIAGLANVVEMSAGCNHALFRRNDGTVWVTGSVGATGGSAPAQVAGLANIVGIGGGCGTAFAIRNDGVLFAWGGNSHGQIGDGTTTDRPTPVQVTAINAAVTAVDLQQDHAIARTADGTVWTWGYNDFGQLGNGTVTQRPTPARVTGVTNAIAVAAGFTHSLVLRSDGTLLAWGNNGAGSLGDGTTSQRLAPVAVAALENVTRISAGSATSFAVRAGGTAWGWGSDRGATLPRATIGDGTYAVRVRPALVLREEEGNGNLDGNKWFLDLDPAPDNVPGAAVQRMVPVTRLFGGERSTSVSASINYRLADYGKQVSTFVLARVPPSFLAQVKTAPSMSPAAFKALMEKAGEILVQLTPLGWTTIGGQLVALTTSTINANGSSNNILNGVNLTTIPGASFCIGYGESAADMLSSETLREVLTLEGATSTASGLPCVLSGVYVSGPTAANSGSQVTLTATVVGTSPTGSVQVKDVAQLPGVNLGAALPLVLMNEAVGQATYATSSLAPGSHSITASYSGDAQNPAADSALALRLQVSAATTGSSVSIEGPVGSRFGDTVSFTAIVTGNNPTGTLQFKDGAANLGTAVGISEGRAVLTLDDLALGGHAIGAQYAGDGGNTASVSNTVSHTVSAALTTSVSLASSVNPVASGAGLTLTATVSGVNPSGNVTFRDGSATLGTTALVGGTASLLVSSLEPGLHVLSADYAGDGSNAAASSPSLFQQVSPTSAVTLTVTRAGTGSGTVTSSPSGVSCGSVCSAGFASGSPVTLSAAPTAGSTFAGWSGGGCSGTGSCIVTMSSPATVTATFDATTASNPPRLANISTRMQVLTGDNVLIGGFIIGGSAPKTVVVRARGPSLTALGVPNALANPALDLYSGQTVIASNDNHGGAANAAQLQASGFAPAHASEAAILVSLNPGAYTAIVTGVGGTTGVGLIEVFEVDGFTIPLINIATRGQVLTGDDVMIGGFIIQGSGPQTVVVRGRGPSLTALGVPNALANPQLQLYSGQTVIASNDNYGNATNVAQLNASGFAPPNSLEAAILITLNPGAYTAIVSGVGGTTGVGIVEVFAVP